MSNLKPSNTDCLVVGAGAAGLEMARVLSQKGHRVTLLEVGGGSGRHLYQRIPLLVGKAIANRELSEHAQSVAQLSLNGRQTPVLWGRGLGGSSRINGNVAEPGAVARWKKVLPFLDACEVQRLLDGVDDCGGHPIQRVQTWTDGLSDVFLAAAQTAFPPTSSEVSEFLQAKPLTVNTRNGWRYNHFDGFRETADHQRIDLLQGVRVTRLLWQGERAMGVEFADAAGGLQQRFADRVVLCAGAIGSAALLLRSGVGNAKLLEAAGVKARIDSPHVGQHLQDHANVRLPFLTPGFDTLNQKTRGWAAGWEGVKWLCGHPNSVLRGPGASVGVNISCPAMEGEVVDPFEAAVRIQLVHFTQDRSQIAKKGIVFERAQKASLGICNLWPKSEGRVTLTPTGDIQINPGFLSHAQDMVRTRFGLICAQALIAQMGFERSPEWTPQKEEDFLRQESYSGYHLIGTCKMALSPDAGVVDPKGSVFGAEGLVVADASVFPAHVSSHSYLPTVAIARRLAQQLGH